MDGQFEVTYSGSFVIFWGFGLGAALACGGLLGFATAATILLMLVHHEHSHIKEAQYHDAKIESVTFGAFGGMINVEPKTLEDEIWIYSAGVINSAAYAASFIAILWAVTYIGRANSWNLADPFPGGMLYWMQFLNSLTLAATVLVITNVLPIWYNSKKHGLVTTDGFAVVMKTIELKKAAGG